MDMNKPMLAVPMSKGNIVRWNDWAIEEKFDGHRLIVKLEHGKVTAFTRPRKRSNGDKTMEERQLPPHLRSQIVAALRSGVYDGELIGGDTSTDVTRLDLQGTLRLAVFDVLELDGKSCRSMTYAWRRSALAAVFGDRANSANLFLATSKTVTTETQVKAFVQKVWERGGEGAILKRVQSVYQPGKRSKDWIKIKKLQHATLTVIGFEPSRGEVFDRGRCAVVVLRDDRGRETKVKTKDDAELAAFNAACPPHKSIEKHPALGRKLVIEYQDLTRDGDYRHPRWDRWEDE